MKKQLLARIAITGFAIGTCLAGLTGCGLLPQEEELPTAPLLVEGEEEDYVVSQVVRGDVVVKETVRATYMPSSQARLEFKLGDEKVSKVYVEVGDTVKAGDLLMELDVSGVDEQIRQQQNQIDDLYLSLQHLYENQGVSLSQAQLQDQQAQENSVIDWVSQAEQVLGEFGEQAQQIRNSIQVAEQRMKELQEDKQERQVIATIDGTVTYIYEFEEGERSVKDKKVITLSNMDEALFEIYSENGDLLEMGQTYTLTCNDNEYQVVAQAAADLPFEGLKENGVYLTMVTPDPSIEQGASGNIEVILEESWDTLYVATNAVRSLRGDTVVYCIDEDGFREMRSVKTGITTDKVTEILEGLEEEEVVVVE